VTRPASPRASGNSTPGSRADIRHRVAYLRVEAHWLRSERLRDLRPLDRDVDPDLLRPRSVWRHWPLAAAASVLLALSAAGILCGPAYDRLAALRNTHRRLLAASLLEDGSVGGPQHQQRDQRASHRCQAAKCAWVRGEGRFQVAHDPVRPFTVSAVPLRFARWAPAFSVRAARIHLKVDVVVTEGKVAIASAHVLRAPPLYAGEAAIVLPDRVSVSRIEPQQLESRLAWTSGRLEFRGETLGEAVARIQSL